MGLVRQDLLEIIGYVAEVNEPNGRPLTAYYTDRHLSPILDQLVEYVEALRPAVTRPEREYIVQIGRADAIKLSAFATNPNGSMRLGNRLTIEAVEGGGLLVRTKPVGYYGDKAELLESYDPVPGLVARGIMSSDHDPQSCEAACCL